MVSQRKFLKTFFSLNVIFCCLNFFKCFYRTVSESMDVDVTGLARGGTRYSSTSSLSSAATASSPQNLQTANTTSIHNQVATAAVVCQTQGLNLAHGSRESPPASSSPGASTPSIPTPAQVSFLHRGCGELKPGNVREWKFRQRNVRESKNWSRKKINDTGGRQNLERRNVERPILRNFKIANIKRTKVR